MPLVLDSGFKRNLAGDEIAMLDEKLRSRFPELVGWSYSPSTGELTLDFGGDVEERVEVATLELELMEIVQEYLIQHTVSTTVLRVQPK